MADTFQIGGTTYTLIDDDDWLVKETRDIDQWIGLNGLIGSGIFTRIACQAAVSIARVDKDVTIKGWLDTASNRDLREIIEQIEAQHAERAAAKEAAEKQRVIEGVVLSPSNGGPEPRKPRASRSSTSSRRAGGSQP